MANNDIQTIVKILNVKNRTDLSQLLEGASSELTVSDQYGSYWFSQISTFDIFAPIENYYKLKNLNSSDYAIILDSVLDIYPHQDRSPEIASVRFRIIREKEKEFSYTQNDVIKFFISYSHIDKEIAGQLKNTLEYFGFEAFLAHEDITPSDEWQARILEELKNCDIFLPLLTNEFKKSDWTSQETGIAYGMNKFIISLKISTDPFGFIGKWQAASFDSSEIKNKCQEIIALIKKKGNKIKLIDSLIRGYANSNNFAEANDKTLLIQEFQNDFSSKQVLDVIQSAFHNSQIHGEWFKSGPFIKSFIRKHIDKKEEIIKRFKNSMGLNDIDDKSAILAIKVNFGIDLTD